MSDECDPNGVPQHSPGAKLDGDKPLTYLMISGFPHALDAVARVTTFGARKYCPNGWREVSDSDSRYMNALARHLIANAIDETDSESGLPHLAHVAWNALAVLELRMRKKNIEHTEK